MRHQIGIFDMPEQGKINRVGQQQVVQFGFDPQGIFRLIYFRSPSMVSRKVRKAG